MRVKQEILIRELLKGESITDACKTAKISRNTYYIWMNDKNFSDELKSRKQAILTDCVAYIRDHFKDSAKELVGIIENPETPQQIKINAIDSLFRNHKSIIEISTDERFEELEQKIAELERIMLNEEST